MSTDRSRTPADAARETPVEVEGVPAEEGISEADVAERLDEDPEQQKNFTEADVPEDT